jgi:regulator of protease activity HflC (stomatin/prohibitin superfamily)
VVSFIYSYLNVHILGIMCCVIVVAVAIMIGVSFSRLEDFEVGIEYNPNAVSINKDKLYERGTHFLGLGHSFIKFSKNLRTIQMGKQSGQKVKADITKGTLTSRTKDALSVTLTCSFQYRVGNNKAGLIQLYENFGEDYESAFIRLARNILRDEMAKFDALKVFQERTQIELAMKKGLANSLVSWNAIVESFQLLDITLPSKFTRALTYTENLNLQKKTEKLKQTQ